MGISKPEKGAKLPNRLIPSVLAVSLACFFAACKKKEEPAVIEEVPAAAAPVETDTSATLVEEPSLKKVGEEAPAAAPSMAAQDAGFSDRGSFVVQVSVFKSKRQAANLVEKLANSGFPAYVAEVENPTADLSGTWQRVRIGRFQRIADARSFGENTLRGMGYDYWVDNKKNDNVGSGDGDAYSSSPAPVSAPVEEMPPPAPVVSEPATPAGDAWGTPKSEPAPSEPAAPAGDAWGTPKPDTTRKSPTDTGKVNLDEW